MFWTIPQNTDKIFNKTLSKKFFKLLDPLINGGMSISYGNSILSLDSLDILRLIYEYDPKSEYERIFKKIIIKNFSDAEKVCPGSGIIATVSFLKGMESRDLNADLLELKELSKYSTRGNLNDLSSFIDQITNDESVSTICKKIIKEGGFSASCSVETTYELQDRVFINTTSFFNVRLDQKFSSSTKISQIKKSNADIIIADGIIEEVSEIHHVLEHYHDNKKCCFLICRGYGDEVISTLSTNFSRKSLNVIPGVLVYNLDSINTLKDICVISNSGVVSTLKGDRFSKLELSSIKSVDFLNLGLSGLEIKNENQFPKIVSLIKNLRKQLEEEPVEDKKSILEKRIASLSPRKATVFLSNHDKDKVGIKKDRIKTVLALINDFCQNGFIDTTEIKNESSISKLVLNKNMIFPARCFFEGIRCGIMNASLIRSTGQIILEDS